MFQSNTKWTRTAGIGVLRQEFMLLVILDIILIKLKSKIGYPQDTISDCLDWEPAVITATYVHSLMGRALRFHITIPKVLEQPWKHFNSLKLCKCSQILSPRVVSTPNRTKTNNYQLNHLQTLHAHDLARGRSEKKLSNLGIAKVKLGLISLLHSTLLKSETER